jgi:hypothetical protein
MKQSCFTNASLYLRKLLLIFYTFSFEVSSLAFSVKIDSKIISQKDSFLSCTCKIKSLNKSFSTISSKSLKISLVNGLLGLSLRKYLTKSFSDYSQCTPFT